MYTIQVCILHILPYFCEFAMRQHKKTENFVDQRGLFLSEVNYRDNRGDY